MTRLPELNEDALTPEQRAIHDEILAGPRGQVVGPLRVWLQSPGLADKAQALGQYARYDSALPPKLSELAILVTGRYWGSEFEWSHHAPIALAAGVPEAAVDAIGQGERPELTDETMAAVFDFAVELNRDKRVSDAVFARASAALGTPGVVDLVGVCGYYTLISMTINAFDVPYDGGPRLPAIDTAPHDMFRQASGQSW